MVPLLVQNFYLHNPKTLFHRNIVRKATKFETILPGLQKSVIKPGKGKKCAAGEHVFVHYTLRALHQGTNEPRDEIIDSSRHKSYRKRGFYFKLGARQVRVPIARAYKDAAPSHSNDLV